MKNMDLFGKEKNDEGIIPEISNLVNAMEELRNLVKTHKIEPELYHSSNLGLIYNIMGKQGLQLNTLTTKWTIKKNGIRSWNFSKEH